MASSDRVQVTSVAETTVGTMPVTPRMRLRRLNGETLTFTPLYDTPAELRSDRMNTDPSQIGTDSKGTLNFALIYPVPNSPLDSDIISAFYNPWTNTNSRDNDGTADSIITDVATINEVLTVTTGTAFVPSELYRFSGFAVAGNNGTAKCTTGSATIPRFLGFGLTNEAAPAAAARVKCVGCVGGSGEISATASGLASSGLDFTTIPGLAKGRWVKVGGTAAGDKFATALLNDFIRITAVTSTALTCDHLPAGWTTDAGAGKTIKIWFGDQIINGVTPLGQTIERGHLGQNTPTYLLQKGMIASQLQLTFKAKTRIDGVVTYIGMSGSQGTASVDAVPDAAPAISTYPSWACSANVGRVTEGGSTLASPNFVQEFMFTINNNNRTIDAVDLPGPAGIAEGDSLVTGTLIPYFGDNTLLTKFFNGTPTSVSIRAAKGSQAQIWTVPRITYNAQGSPNASAKSQDVMLPLGFQASKDETITNAQILWDRFEYYEA